MTSITGENLFVTKPAAIIKRKDYVQIVIDLEVDHQGRVTENDRELARYVVNEKEIVVPKAQCINSQSGGVHLLKSNTEDILFLAVGERITIPDDFNSFINPNSIEILKKIGVLVKNG